MDQVEVTLVGGPLDGSTATVNPFCWAMETHYPNPDCEMGWCAVRYLRGEDIHSTAWTFDPSSIEEFRRIGGHA